MVGRTLTRYMSIRFVQAIAGVFGTIFALVYLLDFVEMLRRAAGIPEAGTGLLALLCLLRVPEVTEQVLPFAVLAGSLFAFVSLSRKLELVVARAAGISVWQFLVPPVMIVLLIGIFSVTVYNPMCAAFKERADRIETGLFKGADTGTDTSLWIRQRSADGQSILRAEQSSDNGTRLASVTAFVYRPNGAFQERVEAPEATLTTGFWILKDARVSAPEAEPKDVASYRLATTLSAEQVTQSFVAPEAVSFWALADTARRIEGAGLDANRYRLRFQSLLARPLMLVAMVLIAASFSLRFFRFGGIAKMVSGGVAAGFMLYVATKLIGDLGGAGLLSASVAAWSPAIIGSLLGTLVLLHQEDG